ncbi:MAG: hypothetical protein AB1925_02630 [Actinomycetota bacterium]
MGFVHGVRPIRVHKPHARRRPRGALGRLLVDAPPGLGHLARDLGVFPSRRGPLANSSFIDTVLTLAFALLGRTFAFVRALLSLVCGLLTVVSDAFPLVGDSLPLVSHPLTSRHFVLAPRETALANVSRLRAVDIGTVITDHDPTLFREVVTN